MALPPFTILQWWCFMFAFMVCLSILMKNPYPGNLEKLAGSTVPWLPHLVTYLTLAVSAVCLYKMWENSSGGGGGGGGYPA